jgi:hypothetical protein
MKDEAKPMPYDMAQDVFRKSLLNAGMTWSEACKAVKHDPRLQEILKELRKGAKDENG